MNLFNKIKEKVEEGSVLYIDFDDTLVDFCGAWLKNVRHKELEDLKQIPNTKEEIDSFRFFKVDSSGRTEKSLSSPRSYIDIEPTEGAIDFIKKLRLNNIDFKILTTTYNEEVELTKNLKLKEIFNIDKEDIIHTLCKQKIIKGNILIDDAIHNVKAYEEDEETLIIMIEQPWNIRYKSKYKIKYLKEII